MQEFDPLNPFGSEYLEIVGDSRKEIRLLVIDEQRDYFQTIQDYAEMCSHEYSIECTFACEEDITDKLYSWHPSLVIVDAYVGKDAFSVVKKCRDAGVSVIVVSETLIPEVEISLKDLGANGYLSKSQDPDDMDFILAYIATTSREQLISQ